MSLINVATATLEELAEVFTVRIYRGVTDAWAEQPPKQYPWCVAFLHRANNYGDTLDVFIELAAVARRFFGDIVKEDQIELGRLADSGFWNRFAVIRIGNLPHDLPTHPLYKELGSNPDFKVV